MEHSTIKGYFILIILVFAFLLVLCQCECLQCQCKKKNRINVNPPRSVEIRDNEIIVIGIPVNAFEINREGEEAIVVGVIH